LREDAPIPDSGARAALPARRATTADVATHRGFADEHALPQLLLADPSHTVLQAYGAWGAKVLYGRTSVGVIRSAVLLGADGTVLKVWKRAQARTFAERALAACRTLLAA